MDGGPGFNKEERTMASKHWGGVAAYGLPGLIFGLGLAWWGGGHGPTARAQAAPPGTSNGTIAFTSTSNGSSAQMLYLIDTTNQAFAVYRFDPTSGARGDKPLKLEATRKYGSDLRLTEFNNQPPEVSAIEAMVKSMAK